MRNINNINGIIVLPISILIMIVIRIIKQTSIIKVYRATPLFHLIKF